MHTHRTGLTSVANVDTYLRALAPDASKGYGAMYYANSGGVTYSQHTNRPPRAVRAGHWLSPPPSYQIYTTIFGLGMEAFPKLIDRLNELGKEISAV